METLLAIKFATSLMRAVLLGMLANVLLFTVAYAQTTEPVMVAIAYPATSEESIPRASLRAILGMRLQKWPADTPVNVVVLNDY